MVALGRVAAIGVVLKKQWDKKRYKQNPTKHYLAEYVEKEENNIKKKKVIRFTKIPYAVWVFGTIMMAAGITVFVFILMNRHLLFEEFDHLSLFWKYVICLAFFLLGLIAILTSEIYTIVINKHLNALMQRRRSLLGKSQYNAHILSDFKTCYIVKRGHVARDTDTSNYYIEFEFGDGVKIESIYDRNLKDIKKKYAQIIIYLGKTEGVDFGDVKYYDETTKNYHFVYKSPFSAKEEEKPKQKPNATDLKKYSQLVDRYRPLEDYELSSDSSDESDKESEGDDANDNDDNNPNILSQNNHSSDSLNKTEEDSIQFRRPIQKSD